MQRVQSITSRRLVLNRFVLLGFADVVQTLSSESTKILKITDRTPRDEQKRDTDTEYDKHKKRCKSKSTNDKKWERPAGYYREYETRRRGEGRVTRLRIKSITALLFEICPLATPSVVRMIPYVVCLADREFRCHSYRHVSYLQTHQGTLLHGWIENRSLEILPAP